MSKDISSQYTKEQNIKNGRKGYYNWKRENQTNISPKAYGDFLRKRR